jgi:thiamine-phosphate pyrophosphorylase
MGTNKEKKIYIVTAAHKLKGECEIYTELFREGIEHLHLRKNGYTDEKLKKLIEQIPSEYHKRIILHSNYKLCKELDLGGIHITRKAKKRLFFMYLELNWYKNQKDLVISTSYHSTRKIETSPDYYTYLFMNSLFGSIREGGQHSYKRPLQLEEFLRSTHKDVIALGGIDLINIESVKEMGFKNVAFHGAIWGFEDPLERFIKLRDVFFS